MCHQLALGMAGEEKGGINVTPLPFSSMQIPYMRRMFGDSNFFRVWISFSKMSLTLLWKWTAQ